MASLFNYEILGINEELPKILCYKTLEDLVSETGSHIVTALLSKDKDCKLKKEFISFLISEISHVREIFSTGEITQGVNALELIMRYINNKKDIFNDDYIFQTILNNHVTQVFQWIEYYGISLLMSIDSIQQIVGYDELFELLNKQKRLVFIDYIYNDTKFEYKKGLIHEANIEICTIEKLFNDGEKTNSSDRLDQFSKQLAFMIGVYEDDRIYQNMCTNLICHLGVIREIHEKN